MKTLQQAPRRNPPRHCQCENASHFPSTLKPGQLPKHTYHLQFPADQTTTVKTLYGSYVVCKACAESCMAEHILS